MKITIVILSFYLTLFIILAIKYYFKALYWRRNADEWHKIMIKSRESENKVNKQLLAANKRSIDMVILWKNNYDRLLEKYVELTIEYDNYRKENENNVQHN